MKPVEWEVVYSKILSDFNFSRARDEAAAMQLDSIIDPLEIKLLEKLLKDKRANVYGAGPSLELVNELAPGTNIAADGATTYLLKRGLQPDIIVTDLDGKIEDLLMAKNGGGILVVHAHGDNLEAIRKHAGRLREVIGTTQTRPFGKLHNFGGFTDGDRAVSLAHHFGAREIHLYGMDFHGEIGRYSFTKDPLVKKKKLMWAEKLIEYLIERGANISYEPSH
jgi:hypothetical protein